jgi:glycosyltransferase involved in cell wall biosynthesis
VKTLERATATGGLRVAVCWPAARADRVSASTKDPALYEAADGLSHLASHGIEIEVVDPSPRWLNPGHGRGSLLAGIDPWRCLRLFWNYRRYDVLVSIDSSSALLFVRAARLLGLRKPVMVIDPAIDPGYRNRMRVHWAVLPHARRVVVYGQVQREYLDARMGGSAACFVPHRVDCRFFDPGRAKRSPDKGGYVLAVGSDIGRDYETLVEAARQLDLPFILHTHRTLRHPLPPGVRVQAEWISFEELRDLYAGAAVVVVPLKDTLHASGINGLLEALAMGCPTVVSASRGIADYFGNGDHAAVVPVGDARAMAQAIDRLSRNKDEAQKLGRRARAYALAELAMPVYAGRIAALLRECVGNRGA